MGAGVYSVQGYNNQGYNYGGQGVTTSQPLTAEEEYILQVQQMKSNAMQRQQQEAQVRDSQAADGKDDGKIGFWGGVKNFFKGVGNFFKGLVCDENGKFSLWKTIKTVGLAVGTAALCICTAGTAVPAVVAGIGIAGAAVKTGTGIYKVCTAKTDREAEAAWQDTGSGVTALGLSVAGAKASLKASGHNVAGMSTAKAATTCVKEATSGIWQAIRHPMQTGRAAMAYFGKDGAAWQNLSNALSWKAASTKGQETKALDEKIALTEKRISNVEKALFDKDGNVIQSSQTANLQNARNALYESLDDLSNQKANLTINRSSTIEIAKLEGKIAEYQKTLETASLDKTARASLQQYIKDAQSQLNTLKSARQLDQHYNIATRSETRLASLKQQLETATTDAAKANIQAQINSATSAMNNSKNFLRLSNAKTWLADNKRLFGPITAYWNSNVQPDTLDDQRALVYGIACQQLFGQGFENLEQMQAFAQQNGVTAEQLATAIDQQLAAQNLTATGVAEMVMPGITTGQVQTPQEQMVAQQPVDTQQYQPAPQATQTQQYNPYVQNPYSNPYMQNPFAMNMPTSDFNSLYSSPYAGMV